MATADLGAAAPLVDELQKCHLLAPEQLAPIWTYWQNAPQREPSELADFLVGQGVLTRMQADWALEDRASELVLSQFVLMEELGSGSMGAVYKVRSTKSDAWFAIKIVPRRNIVSLNTVVEKVKALRDIRHPRVSALVHLGASGERVYLVWPFLDGGEKLDAQVRRQRQLTPRQAIQIGLQVASGLLPYHEHGLFHGLLKPSDIVIGTDRRVRILDFGVGFLLTSERGKSLLDTMTNTRALARGLDCSSPESIMNPLNRTPAGDQYSLGCILYFCLAGQFPFPNPNPVKKMLGHECEEPTPLRQLNSQVTPPLAAIVQRLMAKKPEERYESITDVVRALQALTQSGPRRLPNQPTAPPAEEEEEDDEPQDQRSSWNVWPLLLTVLAAGIVGGAMTVLMTRRSARQCPFNRSPHFSQGSRPPFLDDLQPSPPAARLKVEIRGHGRGGEHVQGHCRSVGTAALRPEPETLQQRIAASARRSCKGSSPVWATPGAIRNTSVSPSNSPRPPRCSPASWKHRSNKSPICCARRSGSKNTCNSAETPHEPIRPSQFHRGPQGAARRPGPLWPRSARSARRRRDRDPPCLRLSARAAQALAAPGREAAGERQPRRAPIWPMPAPSGRANAAAMSSRRSPCARRRRSCSEAEEKVVVAKRWLLHLPQAVSEYEGPARRLAGLLDADLKQGLAILENKIAILEAYAALAVPDAPSPPAASAPDSPAALREERHESDHRVDQPGRRSENGGRSVGGGPRRLGRSGQRSFETNYWLPLKNQVEATLGALDRLAPILARAQRECS